MADDAAALEALHRRIVETEKQFVLLEKEIDELMRRHIVLLQEKGQDALQDGTAATSAAGGSEAAQGDEASHDSALELARDQLDELHNRERMLEKTLASRRTQATALKQRMRMRLFDLRSSGHALMVSAPTADIGSAHLGSTLRTITGAPELVGHSNADAGAGSGAGVTDRLTQADSNPEVEKEMKSLLTSTSFAHRQQHQPYLVDGDGVGGHGPRPGGGGGGTAAGGRSSVASSWILSSDDLDIERNKKIGLGAFGAVYKGYCKGKEVAIKSVTLGDLDESNLAAFHDEVSIMSKLHHPNVLLFMGACSEMGQLLLVTEFMKFGSVHTMLHGSSAHQHHSSLGATTTNANGNGGFVGMMGDAEVAVVQKYIRAAQDKQRRVLSFKRRMLMAKDAALGMTWLHRSNPPVMHLDLKTANLLVDENFRVKIADFGLSRLRHHVLRHKKGSSNNSSSSSSSSHSRKKSKRKRGHGSEKQDGGELQQEPNNNNGVAEEMVGAVGSPLYMAPEMLLQQPYTEKADVYSFGIVLWEMAKVALPYATQEFEHFDDVVDAIGREGVRPSITADNGEEDMFAASSELRKVVTACWAADASARPSFADLVEDQVFDRVIVDHLLLGSLPRKLWRQKFLGQTRVPWRQLWRQLAHIMSYKPTAVDSAGKKGKKSVASSAAASTAMLPGSPSAGGSAHQHDAASKSKGTVDEDLRVTCLKMVLLGQDVPFGNGGLDENSPGSHGGGSGGGGGGGGGGDPSGSSSSSQGGSNAHGSGGHGSSGGGSSGGSSGGGGKNGSDGGDMVSIEDFARMIAWFGPLKKGDTSLLDRVYCALSLKGFFGTVSSQEAENVLKADGKKGAYLVRYSSEPGHYAISALTKKEGVLRHYRVAHIPGTVGPFQLGGSFDSLADLIQGNRKELGLDKPLGGSKFERLFNAKLSKFQVSDGYVVDV